MVTTPPSRASTTERSARRPGAISFSSARACAGTAIGKATARIATNARRAGALKCLHWGFSVMESNLQGPPLDYLRGALDDDSRLRLPGDRVAALKHPE